MQQQQADAMEREAQQRWRAEAHKTKLANDARLNIRAEQAEREKEEDRSNVH